MRHLYLLIYLTIMNLFTLLAYGNDKHRARKNRWRISEKTLIILALAGGSAGAWLGMQLFRHKTQKPLFKIGIPCIFMLQAVILTVGIYFGFI